jgi:PAS domain-containing protein
LRALSDPVEIQTAACRVLSEQLSLGSAQFSEIDLERRTVRNVRDYYRSDMPSHVGEYPMEAFPVHVEAWTAGRTIAVDNVAADDILSEGERDGLLADSVAAALSFPLLNAGRVVAVMAAFNATPRAWTADDRALVEEVAARTWEAVNRRRAEEDLRDSEERFRALVTATSQIVYRMSPDWRATRALDGGDFLGDAPESDTDWLGDYVYEEDRTEVMAAIRQAIESKCAFELEHRVRRPDGTRGWTLSRAVPLIDGSGEIVEWFGAASDVTARREAEELARLAELRLRMAQDAAGVATFDWLIDTREWKWSPEMATMMGLQAGVLGGSYEDWIAMIHPHDLDTAIRSVEEALETGIFEGEWRVVRPDGESLNVLVRGIVERDALNRPLHLTGAQVDITDRIIAEERIRHIISEMDAKIQYLRRQLRSRDT